MGLKIGKGFELPVDVLTEAIGIVATRGAGKTYASVVLIEEAAKAGVPFVVIDATSVYHGLRSSADGEREGLPVYVFGGRHGDLPLEESAGALMADVVIETGHSFVLDVSDFTRGVARRFVSAFLNRLYERKARERSPLLLVVDEADEWAPQKPNRDSALSLSSMELIVKRGRSRGLGTILITQRTQALNKDVLDLIETLFAMRQLAERSREAVKGWIADKESRDELGVIDTLPSLPTGTAWVWSPLRGILERVEIRRIQTFDSYGSTKPGEVERGEPARRTELDLESLGERMAATVQRARENDPKMLRARVGEIDRMLPATFFRESTTGERVTQMVDAWQRAIKVNKELELRLEAALAETKTEVVEVKAVDTATVDELRAIVGRLADALDGVVTEREGAAQSRPGGPSPARASRQPADPIRRVVDVHASRSATPPPTPGASNGSLTGPEQRVLDAVRWYGVLGNDQPSKTQVGFIAGYRVGKNVGGTYGNILGKLRSRGLLEYPSPSLVRLTEDGYHLANDPGIDPTNEAMQAAVMDRLNGPEQRVLSVLIDEYPNALGKQELGARAGYNVGANVGGTFGNILGRLRSLGVADYPAPGEAVATPVLFPLG